MLKFRSMIRYYAASMVIGATIGGIICAVYIRESDSWYRQYCDSHHGRVGYELRWESGPLLVTVCNR